MSQRAVLLCMSCNPLGRTSVWWKDFNRSGQPAFQKWGLQVKEKMPLEILGVVSYLSLRPFHYKNHWMYFVLHPHLCIFSRHLKEVPWVSDNRGNGIICKTDTKLGDRCVWRQAPPLSLTLKPVQKQASPSKACLLNTQRSCLGFFLIEIKT